MALQKKEVYSSDGTAPAATASPGAACPAAAQVPSKQLANAEEYLAKHQVQAKVEAAVNEVLKSMPDNALEGIADALKKLALQVENFKRQLPSKLTI